MNYPATLTDPRDSFPLEPASRPAPKVELRYRIAFLSHDGRRCYLNGVPRSEVLGTMNELSSCGARDVRTC